MWVFDPKTFAFLAVNEATTRLYGYTRDEFLSMTLHDVRLQEVAPRGMTGPAMRLAGVGELCRHHQRDGSPMLVEVALTEIEFEGRPALLVIAQQVTEREQAIAEMRESEARKVGIVENVRDCVIAADHAGRITEFNAAAEQVFGYLRAEALGREIAEILIPQHLRSRHRRGWAHYIETGERHIIGRIVELTALRSDGTEFPAEVLVSSIQVGQERAFTASIRDLTERKRSESHLALQYVISRVLAESEDLHQATREIVRAVCEAVEWDVGAIWQVDSEAGGLRLVDLWHIPGVEVGAFEQKSRETLMRRGVGLPGRVWARAQPAWIADVVEDANFPRGRVAAECGLRGAFGFPVRVDDEVVGVVEFFSHEVRQPDEDLLLLFASIGNQIGQFIKRKQDKESLRQTNDMLQTLLRSSPLAIVHLSADLLVRFWNPAAERLFGWTEREVLGRPYPDLLPAEKRDEFRRLRDTVLQGREIIGYETVRRRKDGSEVRVLLSVAPLRGPDREVTGMLGVIVDLDAKMLA